MSSQTAHRVRQPACLLLALLLLMGGLAVVPSAGQAATNGVRIVTVDGDGHRIKGACFWIDWDDESRAPCDYATANGLNGVTSIFLLPGSYTTGALRVPPGYKAPAVRTFVVEAGKVTTVTIRLVRGANTLKLRTVDAASQLVPGGCYRVKPPVGRVWLSCDDDDGVHDGITRFGGLSRNTKYEVTLWIPPTGYAFPTETKYVTFYETGKTKTQTWVVEPE